MAALPLTSVMVINYDSVSIDDLEIGFHRTERVPGDQVNNQPPWADRFPLYQVADYVDKLPESMVAKGGLFFPMYRM